MSESIIYPLPSGPIYIIPDTGDQNWGANLTQYFVAIPNGMVPTAGSFALTGDINFGNTYGLISKYITSESLNPATSGILRLSNTDSIDWKNYAGSGNDVLSVDSSDNLLWNGSILNTGLASLADGKIWIGNATNVPTPLTLTGDVTVTDLGVTAIGSQKIVNAQVSNSASIAYSKLNLSGSITNSDIYSSAAIAYSKLALSNSIVNADINSSAAIGLGKLAALNASIVPVTDGSGFLTSSSTTATELGYVHGVTSAIQTQLNGKQATLTEGNLTEATSSVLTITGGTSAVIGSGTSIQVKQASATVSGYLSSTDWSTFNAKAPINSPAFTGSPTAPTNTNLLDVSTQIATDAFVQNAVIASMATLPLNLNGISGQVSFASQGINCLLTISSVSGTGSITGVHVTFSQGGTGYKVGDCVQPLAGNNDAVIYIATVSSGAVATVSILYGGSGYTTVSSGSRTINQTFPYTFLITGALAGDTDLIIPNGTYLFDSDQWIVCNNTTGGHHLTMHLSNGSDGPTGNGVSFPAGTNNSTSIQVQTDGVNDVWYAGVVYPIAADNYLLIGQSNGLAAAKAMSGDATIADTGALTLATVNSSPGSTTLSSITTNGKGLVTANSSASTTGSGAVVLATSPTFLTSLITPVADITATTNQLVLGTTKTITISSTAPATSGTYTIPDVGTVANFVLDKGNYTIGGTWGFSNNITLASAKSLVLTDNTTNTITLSPPSAVTTYTLTLPIAHATAGQYLYDAAGNGVLSWNTPSSSGVTGSGTSGQNAVWNGASSITSGATMSMNNTKITSLANGTASSDAAAFGQIFTGFQAPVQTVSTTAFASSSTSYVATNCTASITPTSSSHRIKITVSACCDNIMSSGNIVYITLYRGTSTNLGPANGFIEHQTSSVPIRCYAGMQYIDSPATSSSVTYTVYQKVDGGSGALFGVDGTQQIMILEEIV